MGVAIVVVQVAALLAALGVPAAPSPAADPVGVLGAWLDQRREAYVEADAEALADLYRPDSGAGRADVATLRAYAARGVRVTDLRVQVSRVRVVESATHRLRLRVRSRLARTTVEVGGATRQLPGSSWRVRELVLHADDGGAGWVLSGPGSASPGSR